jgi:integrase
MFQGDRGREHVSATTVLAWVKRIAELAGVQGVTCQRLRATAGTTAANQTGDVHAAAALLGHVDVNVTMRHYTVLSDQRRRAAVDVLGWSA